MENKVVVMPFNKTIAFIIGILVMIVLGLLIVLEVQWIMHWSRMSKSRM